jgi:hypothetical protein
LNTLCRVTLPLVVACAAPAWADDDAANRRAAADYVLHCSGCHDTNGSGHPAKGIPDFREQVGYFLRWPDGRAFLLQVPGLINSGLSDERRAAVTTWLVRKFAGSSLPPEFTPYTAAEAKRYREMRPANIASTRAKLYERAAQEGLPLR